MYLANHKSSSLSQLSTKVSLAKITKGTNGTTADTMECENPRLADSYPSEQQKKTLDIWQAIFKLQASFDEHVHTTMEPSRGKKQDQVCNGSEAGTMGSQQPTNGFTTALEELEISPKHIGQDESANLLNLIRKLLNGKRLTELIVNAAKHESPDSFVLRYFRARKWEVGPTLCMLMAALHWYYYEARVESDILRNGEEVAIRDSEKGICLDKKLASDFMKQVRMGKSFLHGRDKEGRPIWYARVRLHKPSDQCNESIERYTLYLIETIRLMLTPPVETITIVYDMTGFSIANMDYSFVKFSTKIFEANYPETLGYILIHNAPWVFQGVWKLVRGWLDPAVADKIRFTTARKGLEEFIAPENLIKELGGDDDWSYRYEEPVSGENEKLTDAVTRDRLLSERESLTRQFVAITDAWLKASDHAQLRSDRSTVLGRLQANYAQLDPYLRSRSLYDRQGTLVIANLDHSIDKPDEKNSSS